MDLHDPGDGGWLIEYPSPEQAMPLGEERVYNPGAKDCVVFTFGNGVPMSLRAARAIEAKHDWKVRVVDLRWLVPLNKAAIAKHAAQCDRILVDEGRRSVGADTFTPLAGAAFLVIPSEEKIMAAADFLAAPIWCCSKRPCKAS